VHERTALGVAPHAGGEVVEAPDELGSCGEGRARA
jgi:hypothetical protein